MSSVFISHSSVDDQFVERLATDLRRLEIPVWVDDARVIPGDDIIAKIQHGLESATHVLVVLSPSSVVSRWVMEELHVAQLQAITNRARLIPILYGAIQTSTIPLLVRHRLCVDFRREEDYSRALASLVTALSSPSSSRQAQTAGAVSIDAVNFLSRDDNPGFAIECLVRNAGLFSVSTRKFSLSSNEATPSYYAFVPPTVTLPIHIVLGYASNGTTTVSGTVRQADDEWRRPVVGTVVIGPQSRHFALEVPLYVVIGSGEECLIRMSFEQITKSNARSESRDWYPACSAGEPAVGTEINLELAGGSIIGWVHPAPVLEYLLGMRK